MHKQFTDHNTIYIDCSYTYFFGGNTGIQRVARNIINNLDNTVSKNQKMIPVAYFHGNYIEVKSILAKKHIIIEFLRTIKRRIFLKLTKRSDNTNDDSEILSTETLSRKTRVLIMNLIRSFISIKYIFNKKISINRGDTIFIIDNFWENNISQRIVDAHNNGIGIGFMFYDLIPLHDLDPKREKFCAKGLSYLFRDSLKTVVDHADFCIAISETVKYELKEYVRNTFPKKNLPIVSFKLGKDIDNYGNEKNIRSVITNIFSNEKRTNNPYIIVSSIEPRKNHAYVLDVFEAIWRQGSEAKLCVIGVIGWNCSSIIKRLHNHEQLGKKLFVFHDINDIELLFIYKQAKALITASIMEGFGLPIIESLSRRCPVLASDIPVYREVGGDFCSYFDLEDSSSLADIIIKWEKTGQEPPHRNLNEFKWPTWKESTEELLKKIIDLNKR